MEEIWVFKVDTTEVRERCIRLSARTAKKSVKFPSSLEKTVQFTAGIVFPSTKAADVKIE